MQPAWPQWTSSASFLWRSLACFFLSEQLSLKNWIGVAIIAAGITLHEALKAHSELAAQGLAARVIDLYCVKPVDAEGLASQLRAAGGRVVTVEDHFAEGGLGEAVFAALATQGVSLTAARRLAVSGVPHSGTPEELLDAFGISARHIAAAARALL